MKKILIGLLSLFILGKSYAQYNINKNLVTPNATTETRALYQFLQDNYGKKVISGAQEMSEITWLKQNTGKEPALMGTDFLFTNRGYTWYNEMTPVVFNTFTINELLA